MKAFTYATAYMEKTCPTLMAWLNPRLKMPVRLFRYYVTPPRGQSGIHIDGSDPSLPFGLNIPVAGSKNTYHTFYDTDPDNLMKFNGGNEGFYAAMLPIDNNKLTVLEEIEVLTPYVMNNSVLHGVRSESDDYRIMFTIRWPYHETMWRNVDEVLDTTGMF